MMFLLILFYSTKSLLQICICNNECHIDCPSDRFMDTPKANFNKYLFSHALSEKDIELYLYSKQNGFTFTIDQSIITNFNISAQTLPKSQSVNIKINRGYFKKHKTIEIKPKYKITLPKLEPYLIKNILETRSSTVPKTVPISVGLSYMKHTGTFKCQTNVTNAPEIELTDDMNENDFGCETQNLNLPNATYCGLRCWVHQSHIGATLEYTFKGVQFELFGTRDPDHGIINLNLDGKIIPVDESGPRTLHVSIYKSELLEYKEHTINISSTGVYEIYKLVYWPSITAKRLNASDIVKTSGEWKTETDGVGGNRIYTDHEGTIIVPMHCRKFWLYGIKQKYNDQRKITLKYGDVTKEILVYNEKRIEQDLLYESPELDDFHVNLSISGRYMFSFVFFEELPTPISVGLSLMNIEGVFKCYHKNTGSTYKILSNDLSLGSFNCNFQNLDSTDASKCGLRCWTDGDSDKSKCNLGYKFKGVKFALYGTFNNNHGKFDVLIDGENVAVVDEYSSNRLEYAVLYTSKNLPYGEHYVQIRSKNEMYEMYKLVYWPSLIAKRINVTEVKEIGRTWIKQSDGVGGVQKYVEGDPLGQLEVQMHCTRFRIYGLKDDYHESGKFITINYNGITKEIPLNATKRTEISLLYESEDLSIFNFLLSIKGSFMLSSIYYDEPSVPISVSLDQMETEGSINCKFSDNGETFPLSKNIDHTNSGCDYIDLNSPNAYQCGLRCWSTDGIYSYKFKGVKFAVYGASNRGPFDIELDNRFITPIEKKSNQDDFALLYESNFFNYKEHEVRFISKNSDYLIYKLVYWPNFDALRINSTDFTLEGNWRIQSDKIGGAEHYCDAGGCTAKVTLKCSQFWVYGVTDSMLGEMTLNYKGNAIKINQHSDSRVEGVLLYQSPNDEYGSYELTFTSAGALMMYCIYYNWQAPQPMITPVPISVNVQNIEYTVFDQSQINFTCKTGKGESVLLNYTGDLNCDLDNLDTRDAYQCGVICTVQAVNFAFHFTGVKVAIIGQKLAKSTLYIGIDVDPGYNYTEIHGTPKDEYETLYTSPELPYGDHTLYFFIKHNDHDTNIFKVEYWPSLRAKRLNSSDFMTRTGIWKRESDRVGGVREYTHHGDENKGVGSLSKKFSCSKFWLYGSKAECFKDGFTLSYDGITETISNLGGERKDGVLLYESHEFANKMINLTETTKGESMFYFVYYMEGPLSLLEYIDKEFNELLPYNDVFIQHDSYINQISGCMFNNVIEYLDYMITLEKEVIFDDNIFVENNEEHPTPLRIKYDGSITIKNCTFTNTKGRSKNEASVFYCDANYKINAVFDSCTFNNPGNQNNKPLIKIENGLSNIIVNNTNFLCTENRKTAEVLNAVISNAIIENCSFNKVGGIYIEQSTSSTRSLKSETNKISITNCTINDCYSSNSPYTLGIQIHQESTELIFEDNEISEVMPPNDNNCIVYINTNKNFNDVIIKNCLFINNVCYSYYGGGSGIQILDAETITFQNCSFQNNKAKQNRNQRSPEIKLYGSDEKYENGDGGGIQIGFGCKMNEVDIIFNKCNFSENKAQRHGGAISIQTLKKVEITDCIFESNYANYDFPIDSNLLEYETHYHKKINGRGGAIYINPAYSYTNTNGEYCYDKNLFMSPVIIQGCQFLSNSARDGFAIYIEGDDPGTIFNIETNNFTNNYNFRDDDRDDDVNLTKRGVIATEIYSFPENVSKVNEFNQVYYRKLVYVDHYGNRVTKAFTESNNFTISQDFTKSGLFSESKGFSNSDKFTKTSDFTKSDLFTKSQGFTNSDKFSESNDFSVSDKFTKSDAFSKSQDFLPSDEFTKSKDFSSTSKFSNTQGFSNSDKFSESTDFTVSDKFTKSDAFSESQDFLPSDEFTKSKDFSSTSKFSNTQGFTNSDKFSESNDFSVSDKFTKSDAFSESQDFLPSDEFTKSKDFSSSSKFSNTQGFSNSDKFSESNDFTVSSKFTKSSDFSQTKGFSKSNDFSQSFYFSKSEKFSSTDKFTKTQLFSASEGFSKSNPFSESTDFTKSNDFSQSFYFSKTEKFSNTDKFSKTQLFSTSDKFTKSNEFSKTKGFSKSNDFSQSFYFSKTEKFSNTDKFTKTQLFSASEGFSKSNPFSESTYFTKSNGFSQSFYFSKTEKFSSTDKFSKTQLFSASDDFSKSNPFSESTYFTKSNDFSQSFYFSKTEKFSNTDKFSKTQLFSTSDKFTKTNEFSKTKGFSKSNDFSQSFYFSNTEKFSGTSSFTYTQKFSPSNYMTDSAEFTKSDEFSKSKFFTRTNPFSNTNKFSNTIYFTSSNPYSTSDKFSKSSYFSSSMKFSETSEFSNSFYFSQSTQFSDSVKFSKSDQFSESEAFSPSVTLIPNDPKCIVFDSDHYMNLNDCRYSVDSERLVYIFVISDQFEFYNQIEGDGSAIHLINCGILCNNTEFIDCTTNSGGGGAIFINNSFEITNNATFINTTFLRCEASYGGAVFIYAQSILFDISFTNCSFESNKALMKKPPRGDNNVLFGGQALFAMCQGILINKTNFVMNKGSSGAVKIINLKDENSKIVHLENDEKSFHFIKCEFEQHVTSESSIFYVDEMSRNGIDVVDCKFKGKLKKGSHYISGKIKNKEKLNVHDCTFENNGNKEVNLGFDDDKLQDDIFMKDDFLKINGNLLLAIAGFAILIALFTLIVLKLNISKHWISDSYDSLADESNDNNLI